MSAPAFAPDAPDLAVSFYRAVAAQSETARRVLDFLIDHPDQRFNGAAIMARLGLAEHREVARATYLMGQIAAGLGRSRPWGEGQLGYLMPAAMADLFARARDAGR